jgi:YVTN family beta-propeller protein
MLRKLFVAASFSILITQFLLANTGAAQTQKSSTILALSKGDKTLSIIDSKTLKILYTVPSGPDPHEVIASSDGKMAYISNYGSGSFNTITPVDLTTRKALPVIDLGALRGPHGLTFVDGKLWFTAEGSKAFGSYNPATKKIDLVLGTGQERTHMIYVANGANPIITTNVASATVTIIEKSNGPQGAPPPGGPGSSGPQGPLGGPPSSGPGSAPGGPGPGGPPPGDPNFQRYTETIIPVGHGDEGFDVAPDGKELWVANAQDGTISVVNLADKRVTQTIDANVRGANRLKITPDGKLAFVSTLQGADAVVFDVADRKESKRIPIGHGAAGILIPPDGRNAYIACTPDNYIAVIDIATLTVATKIPNIKNPDGLAWSTAK